MNIMNPERIAPLLLASGLFVAALSPAEAGELPPSGSKPLSAILASVEARRPGVVTSAEFDDGLWEIRICEAGACRKLYVNPRSGEERRRRRTDADEMPPAGALPLSTIVRSVEGRGMGTITEADFDDGFWEIDLRKDGRRIKLAIDPRTGETRR